MYNETKTYQQRKDEHATNFPQMIICHHFGGSDADPLADSSNQTAEIVENWHLQKGWNGIGYHYIIHKNGDIWKGRPEHVEGAHTVGYNSKSLGVAFAGNFDATLPTKEQEQTFKALYKELYARYSVLTPDKVYPHRKYANKTCYGRLLKDDWGSKLAQSAIDIKSEIKDQSLACLAYMEKQNSNSIISFIQKLFGIIRNK